MHRLAYYDSIALAHMHAAYLRDHGIMSGVVGLHLNTTSPLLANNLGRGQYELVIPTKRAEDAARALLDECRASPPRLPEEWEDQVRPDLTRLETRHVPPCPACGRVLDRSRPLGPCMSCGDEHDLIELIVERSGPEALEPCYEQRVPLADLTEDEILSIEIDCAQCGYPLDDLGMRGHCPECGAWFDRRESFHDLLEPEHP